ncbi:hypothetical protein GS676_14045 [Rhodococcus hoagii]|nr:hypothetical protein [Prescottella equi]
MIETMFEYGGGVEELAAGDVARDALRFVELSGLARIENAHAARKVLLAGELTLSALERDVALRGGDIRDCGNEAIAEVSTQAGLLAHDGLAFLRSRRRSATSPSAHVCSVPGRRSRLRPSLANSS